MITKIIIGFLLGMVAYNISSDWLYSVFVGWGYIVISSTLDHLYVGAK